MPKAGSVMPAKPLLRAGLLSLSTTHLVRQRQSGSLAWQRQSGSGLQSSARFGFISELLYWQQFAPVIGKGRLRAVEIDS
ncbi:MAG: hypothetical protein E5Y50_03150 [Mesorhizobium sp.]|nr:MAG: hypothetical protein E5Y50_03150 [Mesorhizobium sp.]